MKKWLLRGCKVKSEEISKTARTLSIPTSIAQLLAIRGYTDIEHVNKYLNCTLDDLHEPSLMKDLDLGCKILLAGIQDGKKIAVFGDYDVDGITSTSILTIALKRLGADVKYYIPHREKEGYGLNNQAIRELVDSGIDILVTCDNGISAIEQISLAKELGMTVIITDHHEVPFESSEDNEITYYYSNADATINPKQADCPYPFKSLCAGGIAYKITEHLYKLTDRNWQNEYLEYLSLAIIATVCDIMDLSGENRAMVKCGLTMIKDSPNLGLRALMEVTGLQTKEISAYHFGFVIGPCINASGRLELADIAVNLFLADNYAEALRLAKELVDLNNSRKNLSNEGVEQIKEAILAHNLQDNKVILYHQPDLNESIAGIVAGRIKEIFYRPTFILAGNKDIVKGSGRSIEGYNMFNALVECRDLLTVFGGHPMAAGLSIPLENVKILENLLNKNCKLELSDMIPHIYIDMQLPIERPTLSLANNLKKLEPFGKGNAMPIFGDKNLSINRIQLLGNNQQIVKVFFNSRTERGIIPAILFRLKDEFYDMVVNYGGVEAWDNLLEATPIGLRVDVAYSIEINEYNDKRYLQLQIKDFREHIH